MILQTYTSKSKQLHNALKHLHQRQIKRKKINRGRNLMSSIIEVMVWSGKNEDNWMRYIDEWWQSVHLPPEWNGKHWKTQFNSLWNINEGCLSLSLQRLNTSCLIKPSTNYTLPWWSRVTTAIKMWFQSYSTRRVETSDLIWY